MAKFPDISPSDLVTYQCLRYTGSYSLINKTQETRLLPSLGCWNGSDGITKESCFISILCPFTSPVYRCVKTGKKQCPGNYIKISQQVRRGVAIFFTSTQQLIGHYVPIALFLHEWSVKYLLKNLLCSPGKWDIHLESSTWLWLFVNK